MKKESIKNRVNRLFGIKLKSKIAALFIDSAIKIIIGVVCGALFLSGIYLVGQKIVLPSTESAVVSMFNYENDNNGDDGENNTGTGGSGGVETPDVGKEDETIDEPVLNEHGFYYNQPYYSTVEYLGGDEHYIVIAEDKCYLLTYEGIVAEGTFTVEGNIINIIVDLGSPTAFTFNISNNGTELDCSELQETFVLKENYVVFDENYVYIYDDSLGGYRVNIIDETLVYKEIKSEINGVEVLQLNQSMFATNLNITEVTIPNNIKIISASAFIGCKNLTSITIPNSVTKIGSQAFSGCTKLNNITFNGTMEEWKNITFGHDDWNYDVPATEVQCSDGSIDL